MKGKHGQAAAVRHEVTSRDAQIAELTRERDALRRELSVTKDRLASALTKLGSWSAQQQEAIQQQVKEGIEQWTIEYGYRLGRENAIGERTRLTVEFAFGQHMMRDHGLSTEAARAAVLGLIEAVPRAARRKLQPPTRPRGRQVRAAVVEVSQTLSDETQEDA